MKKTFLSNRLFANPSFVEGASRLLDLGATLQKYNESIDGNEADSEALSSDWRTTGEDLKTSIRKYEQKLTTTP